MNIPREEMEVLARLALDLTKLRQAECPHLCIEVLAPEILAKLKFAWTDPLGYLGRIGQ